jgi:hypothetical protein
MHQRLLLTTLCIAVPVVSLGCGKSQPDPVAASIADTICPKAYACCTQAQLADNNLAGTNEATCRKKTAADFTTFLASVRTAEKEGRARLNQLTLAACLSHIESSSCETLNTTSHFSGVMMGCDAFVEPKVAPGGPCENDWECIDGSCVMAEGARQGACASRAGEGQSCAAVDCRKGLICHSQTTTCVRLLAEGQPCDNDFQCASFSCPMEGNARGGECAAPASNKCFYASACSYGRGGGTPAGLVLLCTGLALTAAMRKIRT